MGFDWVKERSLRGHQGAVLGCSLAGNYVLTCGEDRTVRLFNPTRSGEGEDQSDGTDETAFLVHTFQGPHGYRVLDVSVKKDHSAFASCGDDKMSFIWDVNTSKVKRKMFGHHGPINSICFGAKNEDIVCSASNDQTIRVYDLRSHNRDGVQILSGFRDSVSSVRISDYQIVAGSIDGCIRTFDVRAAKMFKDTIGDSISYIELSTDLAGSNLVVASCVGDKGSVVLVDRDSGLVLKHYEGHLNVENRIGCGIYSSRTGKDRIICGSEDGYVYIWDLLTGKVVDREKVHDTSLSAIGVSGDRMVSCAYDGGASTYKLVSTETG
uniref:Mitogen-activated protein kinase organizer 1 n=1 Tax=Mucochytrium quahogii TaxID=96639 RepID=A0A7S2W4U6_9STRA|mmetsp:Transcript_30380/g.48488  ORF Transcript_30380/g.48488 Transcript_30380/m.48488 type:complete len:323 (+) Transcript_30380:4095-5063(+)|eukprot:CAMPEP_0203756172 /NCGR_PEP_ID=MMETSP0098-20131031/9487_1 /ASSEMBLY_ACC=CAM_ASM_000208 /TAXON_ID=96639 /ORGANISM=" , Strain NY0313808BC1" /LENGTH=322 /DNA_ID=CAMNT_0050647937 /DNA_START=339 /DNA_END=1307 /DNA_ORIENTATION=-